jgi:AcrR family transcriptional regulator
MPRNSVLTRKQIVEAAYRLLYQRGFARVSIDDIAAAAGITKRSVYNHFESKDDLVRAVLEEQQAQALAMFETWGRQSASSPGAFLHNLFVQLRSWAESPGWRGSGYTRLTMELADLPGHPARKAAHKHKSAVEEWLAARLAGLGAGNSRQLARETVLLTEGCLSLMLIHNDTSYASAAAAAARKLALPDAPRARPKRLPNAKPSNV